MIVSAVVIKPSTNKPQSNGTATMNIEQKPSALVEWKNRNQIPGFFFFLMSTVHIHTALMSGVVISTALS